MDTYTTRNIDERARRSIAKALATYFDEAASLVEPDAPRISVCRAVSEASTPGGLRDGAERELLACAATACGQAFDPHRLQIPFSAFRRDLTAGAAAAGGYLTDQPAAEAWQPLYGHSVVADAGVTVVPVTGGSISAPTVKTDPAVTWQATESAQVAEGTVTFGQALLTPKICGAYVELSRHLLLQGTATEAVVQRILLRAVGRALDAAVLQGSGASGEILGLASTAGIATASGTTLSWATMAQLRATVEAGAGSDRSLQWLGGYTAHRLLSQRERAAGSGFVWSDKRIDGDRAAVTKAAAADTLYLGDWAQVLVALFGPAVRVEIDPFTQFKTGAVGMRVMLAADAAVMQPNAFGVISAIS